MRFVMVGSGAVGGYFGAKLQLAGHDVVFVARGRQLQALHDQGLILRQDAGETVLRSVNVTDDMSSVGPADYVLISVKTWQLAGVLSQLPLLKDNQTRFLTLQNGVEAPQRVADAVGSDETLGGLVRGFFQLEAPGIIRHMGVQPTIIFGQIAGGRSEPAEQLYQCIRETGTYTELSDNIQVELWEKFLLVTSLSGVGAVTRSTIGEIRDYAPAWDMLLAVMHEIAALAHAYGIQLPADTVERTIAFVQTFPPEATTSMQRDLVQGLTSELEAQTGAVVQMGQAIRCSTPVNNFIYHSLILQERRARQAV